MRVYQHEVYGRMIVPTIVREGADLIDLAHILRWEVMKHHRARIQRAWDERRKRRQGKADKTPAEPQGGGKAA